MPERILLVEDDERLGAQVTEHLRGAGYEVRWLKDGDTALAEDVASYALVVLDLMLPGAYGMDVLKRYRSGSDVPVMILSARNETPDKVRALALGADDYVTKPFWPEELVARVDARVRRPLLQRGHVVRLGALELDVEARRARLDGDALDLTRVEFDVLAVLARRRGAAVSRQALVDGVLDPDHGGTERTLDVHVSRLRKKLGRRSSMIRTVWGIGYRLDAGGDA
jgi:two-component system response regulator MtrA